MGNWTRRGLLAAGVVGAGALVVGVAIRPNGRHRGMAELVADDGEHLVNAWVKIDADNHVTAIIPHSEMGQGAQTALSQMLADELDAAWEDVAFMEAPAADEYANYKLGKGYILGEMAVPAALVGTVDGVFLQVAQSMHLQITGGSTSVRFTGVHGMRVAGAAARAMLLDAGAEALGVPKAELTTADTHVVHAASGRRLPYGALAAAAGERTPPYAPTLKSRQDFRIMGEFVQRHDLPAKVDGSATFGIDVSVPGMKVATIQAAPVFGATLIDVDEAPARAMPGVVDVVRLDDAVAVVADGYWQAKQALARLQPQWSATENDAATSESILAGFEATIDAALTDGSANDDLSTGDAAAALATAARRVERTYRVPYLGHACMEPMNAVAHVQGDRCDIWTGTQNPLGFRYDVAAALDVPVDNVTVTNHFMGGGFGRRSRPDCVIQAARISRAAGVPVKLIWSREEDTRHDHYRPAIASRFVAGLDGNGLPVGWTNIYVDKHEPAEAPYIPYAIADQDIRWVDSPTHVPFGPWRSVDHTQHGFFTESFIDELAHEAGADPYSYRRDLLAGKPRHLAVLDRAAREAGWSTPLPEGRARGISLQDAFGTLVAQVVEITLLEDRVRVDRVVLAADPGFAVSPDGFAAQMESGVIYGLTAALYGEIRIENGAVANGNFDSYPMVRMDDAPVIETHILESDAPWGGAGEPGTPGVAPALVNAIHAATGVRIRELPVQKHLERLQRIREDRQLS